MTIGGYYICGYLWLLYWWILVVINAIIFMIIFGYYISGYWCLLMIINVIILVTIGGYSINGYWWLFYCKLLMVISGYYMLYYDYW
jgi:hypothetical protein